MIKFNVGTQDVPKSVSQVTVVSPKNSKVDYNLPKGVIQKIEKLFADKENGFFTLYEDDALRLVSVYAKDESEVVNDSEELRLFGAAVYKALETEKVEKAQLVGFTDALSTCERSLFLEGMLLAQYGFDKYKKKKNESSLKMVYIDEESFIEGELEAMENLVKAVSFAKDLVNEPVNYLDAPKFSELAKEMASMYGFSTEVFDKAKIEELKMGGLLAVNQGSDTPPTFNIFTHKPVNAVNKQPLVLVGKGVMFDTGGYSLKPANYMSDMKTDMAGAATVLATIMAVAANKVPYYVIGLVPATDNKISANAFVVDDIITISDGTTVEVQNTDAEGRLVLADALVYAKQFIPELVIDLATLTGAASVITGSFGIAMAGNSKSAMAELKKSGDNVYERLMELPMWREFDELLKSEVADLKNIGGSVGGATTAAKFLEHFTNYDWIHLDIAGPASIKKAHGYIQTGGTATGVRLLYNFIEENIGKERKSCSV